MIRQFTYTASPWGVSGTGWMVFQQSKGVNKDEVKALYPVFKYEGVEAERGACPVIQFAYQPRGDGKGAIICQTAFVGMRWWGEPRPGDFFAHVLLADEAALARFDFNPFCYYRSPDLQVAFPDALKEKALKIFRHEIPHEKPPEFPELANFSEIRMNDGLRFDAVLKSVSAETIKKIGTIVCGLVHHSGETPFAFDCTCADALKVWTLAFHLCPVDVRRNLGVAVGFPESVLKRLPVFSRFAVCGTKRKNVACDPETGLYEWEKLPKGTLSFRSAKDVVRFKEMLDGCGEHLDVGGFDRLVDCWHILAYDEQAVSLIKEAAAFIKGHDNVAFAIRGALTEQTYVTDAVSQSRSKQLLCVARYELGLIDDIPESTFEEFIQDEGLLELIFGCLSGSALSKFLGDLYRYARSRRKLFELAKVYLAAFAQGKCGGVVTDAFFQRVRLFALIRNSRSASGMARELNELRKLHEETGGRLEGVSAVLLRMGYELDLANLNNVDGLGDFLARYPESTTLPRDRLERDILARLKPRFVSMTAADICKAVRLVEKSGMPGAHILDSILQTRLSAVEKRASDKVIAQLDAQEFECERRIRSVRIVGWMFGVLTALVLFLGWQGFKWWCAPTQGASPRMGRASGGIFGLISSAETNETLQNAEEVFMPITNAVPSKRSTVSRRDKNHFLGFEDDRENISSNCLKKSSGAISHQGEKEAK